MLTKTLPIIAISFAGLALLTGEPTFFLAALAYLGLAYLTIGRRATRRSARPAPSTASPTPTTARCTPQRSNGG